MTKIHERGVAEQFIEAVGTAKIKGQRRQTLRHAFGTFWEWKSEDGHYHRTSPHAVQARVSAFNKDLSMDQVRAVTGMASFLCRCEDQMPQWFGRPARDPQMLLALKNKVLDLEAYLKGETFLLDK